MTESEYDNLRPGDRIAWPDGSAGTILVRYSDGYWPSYRVEWDEPDPDAVGSFIHPGAAEGLTLEPRKGRGMTADEFNSLKKEDRVLRVSDGACGTVTSVLRHRKSNADTWGALVVVEWDGDDNLMEQFRTEHAGKLERVPERIGHLDLIRKLRSRADMEKEFGSSESAAVMLEAARVIESVSPEIGRNSN